jgi:hypothetical protein
VQLPAARVREVAGWPEVDQVYLSQVSQSELHVAGPAIGATTVHQRLAPTGSGGFINVMGAGIKLGMVEAQGGLVAKHPDLFGIQQDNSLVCQSASTARHWRGSW